MTTHSHTPRRSVGMLAAAAAAAAAMAATVVSAPPVQATCASFWGIGNNADCQSTLFSVAIAIGNGATATADSLFGTALALGTGAGAKAGSPFTFGITAGENSGAVAEGVFGIALNLGANGLASTAGSAQLANLGFNIALTIPAPGGGFASAGALGIGNIATSLFSRNSGTIVGGILNTATTIGASNTGLIAAGGSPSSVLNTAFRIGGTGGSVFAGPGPLAVAGSIFQDNANIARNGPGININGLTIGGGAAATRQRTPSSVAAKRPTRAAPVAANRNSTPKPVSATRARR